MFGLSKDIQFFTLTVFNFRMVTLFSLNYCCIIINCFVVIHRSNQVSLRSQDKSINVLAGEFVLMSSLID